MIIFDVNAGTHFQDVQVGVTTHAIDQAVEDFNVNREEAERWIVSKLRQSQFIGEIYGENRKKVRLYGFERIAFIVAPDDDVVITIYQRRKVDERLRNPVEEVIRDVIKQSEKQVERAESAADRALVALRELLEKAIHMRESAENESVKRAAEEWIQDIHNRIEAEEKQIDEVRQEHARLLKGVVAFV